MSVRLIEAREGEAMLLDGARVRLWPLRPARRAALAIAVDPARVALRAAALTDVPALIELLDGFARRGLLLPRSEADVYRHIREFVVAECDGRIVGCAALRVYSGASAEVGALAVDERCHGMGIGRRLVTELVERARAMGIARVFALTLEAGFFHRLGFGTATVSEFPEKIAADCARCAKRASCIEIAVAMDLL